MFSGPCWLALIGERSVNPDVGLATAATAAPPCHTSSTLLGNGASRGLRLGHARGILCLRAPMRRGSDGDQRK